MLHPRSVRGVKQLAKKKKQVTVAMYGTRKEIIYTMIPIRGYTRTIKGKKQKVKAYTAWRHTKKEYSTRFNFKGTGKQCRKAVALAKTRGWTPRKRFQTVKAVDYLKNPSKYESREKWSKDISKVETP